MSSREQLLAAENPHRPRGGLGHLAELFAGQPVEPFQGPIDVGFRESGLVQFELQCIAIGPRLVVGAHVILEEIDE